jgi:hypothetical protein
MAILVTAEERELMLNEMRFFLDMMYISTDALSRGDMATVARAARRRGTEEMAREPRGLYEKLMPAYRISIEETRKQIDQLADDAEKVGEPQATIKRFSLILYQCNFCHSTFQLRIAAGRP